MSFPPLGYDDESVIPQERLRLLLGQFEKELSKIRTVFEQHIPSQFQSPSIERSYPNLRETASELGEEYSFLVEKLIGDYENFRKTPDKIRLDQVFTDLKNLDILLIG